VDPDILVVDETLAVGDEAFNRKCFSRIEEIKRNGGTILFVSHSSNLVVQLCDRAILLEEGERLLTGDPKMVIARYHRLLYAPASELAAIREEIRRIDAGEEPAARDPIAVAATTRREDAYGRLDPKLRSESTVEYASQGATIRSPRILDPDGRVVNVLRTGQLYTYAYEVEFLEDAFDVRFGMMLKLVTGFELGGQASHPPRRGIDYIEAGSIARVRFPFQTLMVPGVYFVNAGVLGLRDGTQLYLHRMLDAAIFRIDPEGPDCVTGSVDFSASGGAAVEIEAPERRGPGLGARPPSAPRRSSA